MRFYIFIFVIMGVCKAEWVVWIGRSIYVDVD